MARTAERGLFDMLFSADSHTAWTVSESAIHRVHWCAPPAPASSSPSRWRGSSRRST
jgi:hypothetical protein